MHKELIELTSKLVTFPSINPPREEGNMNRIANFIKEWFSENGINAKIKEYEKGWPSVIAEVGKGNKTVLLNGHFDVVPEGHESSWNYPPFGGKIEGNRIYGRGATDMKAGVALAMVLTKELADKVNFRLVFTAVSDEETGGFKCSKNLSEEIKADLVIVTEPSGHGTMVIGEKGLLQTRLITRGKIAHGSVPSLGINAIQLMIEDLMNLSKISSLEIPIPNELKDVILESKHILKEELGKEIHELDRISFNIGLIKGGVKVNVVADYCEAEVDMRIPPGINYEEAFEKVRGLITHASASLIQFSNPNYSSPSNPYVANLKETIEKTLNVKARLAILTGATDGRYFRLKGIPTVIYGPGNPSLAHTYDEYVSIEDIQNCYKVLKNYLLSLN